MIVLGLHCGHDSSLAIAEDGKIIFACEEERLTGNKKETGFPAKSLIFACKELGIESFDKVVYSQKENFLFRPTYPSNKRNPFPDAIFQDHHYCHAVSAYVWSGWDECLVMTLDGGGDDNFGSIYEGKGGKLSLVAELKLNQYPFGLFYNHITEICGFTPNRHEGKIMGLAAHGKVLNVFDGLFWVEGTQINSVGKKTDKHEVENIPKFRLLERHPKENPIEIIDVASSAQKTFEDIIIKWVEVNAKGRKLAVAGGSFANVLANMKIAKIVEKLFVVPPMFDDGLSAGAALSAFDPLPSYRPKDMYLGFSSFPRQGNRWSVLQVAEMVANGAVVGLYQGKMEYGPRALGNRSILADPRDSRINAELNRRLKRTEFMPFAPVILEEYAKDILVDYDKGIDNAPFMTCCWAVKEEWKRRIPAVVHIDGTARPQVISRDVNPYYYDIIDEFRKKTGIPVLINTSFNGHESPIVCFQEEADMMTMRGFKMVDVLVEN